MAERVTGKTPPAEGWTTHIPAIVRRMRMSEYLHSGRSRTATPLSAEEGGGIAVRGRKPRAGQQVEEAQEETRGKLRARFDRTGVNAASVDEEWLQTAEYDFSFEPARSSMLSKLEYDSKRRLLRATFINNGAVMVYGGVPMNVYAQLKSAEDNAMSVGGRFWDLIRIYDRRSLPVGGPYYPKSSNFVREGSKYPFVVEEEGASFGPRGSEYRTETLVDSEGKKLPATKSEAMRPLYEELAKGPDSAIMLEPRELKKAITQLRRMKDTQLRDRLLAKIQASSKTARMSDEELENLDVARGAVQGELAGGYGIVRKGRRKKQDGV